MAYSIPQIVGWMAVCQPLARIGEVKRLANGDTSADVDLDIKLYDTRRDIEYEYAQDPISDNLFAIGNYGLSLCGIYLFQAMQATGGGAVVPISPVTPTQSIISPLPITGADFASALSWTGANSYGVTILSSYALQVFWNGLNRFLESGYEFTRTTTGFSIIVNGVTITAFDATTTNFTDQFYIFISN